MKSGRFLTLVAITAAVTHCSPEKKSSETKDIVTDIDASDEARTVPFIYYMKDDTVFRGECSEGASYIRAQCQNNLKSMPADEFERRVALEVTRETNRLTKLIADSEEKVAKAKDESNALLLANHDLQKKNSEISAQIAENDAKQLSKQTDLDGLEEQLTATVAAINAGASGAQLSQLQAIKQKLTSDIAKVKQDQATLSSEKANLAAAQSANDSKMSENNGKIDALLIVQNEETTKQNELKTELATQESDRADLDDTMNMLKTDLIPFSVSSASQDFEKNKRWIKRFDLVITEQVGLNEVTLGSITAFSGTYSSSSLVFRYITVSKKMDVRELGVYAKNSLTEAHMALYSYSDKKLIVSTESFELHPGENKVNTSFVATIEPGAYLIGIQGNGALSIAKGNYTGVYNYYAPSSSYPDLPESVSISSDSTYELALSMVGDTY